MMRVLANTSLLLCTRDRPSMALDLVRSVLAGNLLPAELVVVDQSTSRNEELAALASPEAELRYFHVDTVGLSRACNTGIGAARHELLAFTHDDILVTPTWFGALLGALDCRDEHAVVTGQVKPQPTRSRTYFAPSTKTAELRREYRGRIGVDVLFPQNMVMHRTALERVGGFDERLGPGTRFPAAEDNDLGFRLLEAGYTVVYEPSAVVYHRAWRTRSTYPALRFGYGRGQGGYYVKHARRRDRYMFDRLKEDLRSHILGAPWRFREDPFKGIGHLTYCAGLLHGAMDWLITVRPRESRSVPRDVGLTAQARPTGS
jgi:GT2 family glycosyltransferase